VQLLIIYLQYDWFVRATEKNGDRMPTGRAEFNKQIRVLVTDMWYKHLFRGKKWSGTSMAKLSTQRNELLKVMRLIGIWPRRARSM